MVNHNKPSAADRGKAPMYPDDEHRRAYEEPIQALRVYSDSEEHDYALDDDREGDSIPATSGQPQVFEVPSANVAAAVAYLDQLPDAPETRDVKRKMNELLAAALGDTGANPQTRTAPIDVAHHEPSARRRLSYDQDTARAGRSRGEEGVPIRRRDQSPEVQQNGHPGSNANGNSANP